MRGMSYYYGIRTSIHIYIYRTSSNLYSPDSVSLASLARQLYRATLHEPDIEKWAELGHFNFRVGPFLKRGNHRHEALIKIVKA